MTEEFRGKSKKTAVGNEASGRKCEIITKEGPEKGR